MLMVRRWSLWRLKHAGSLCPVVHKQASFVIYAALFCPWPETLRTPKTEDRMPAHPRKMKLQKRVGSEDGPWVQEFPEPTAVGSGIP